MGEDTLQMVLQVYISGGFWLHPDIRYLTLRALLRDHNIFRESKKYAGIQHYALRGVSLYFPDGEESLQAKEEGEAMGKKSRGRK
jgi:hypothetical protein